MSDAPLFDQAVYLDLSSELGEEDTAEVLKTFLADTSRKIVGMAAAQADRSTIKREAHSIKSSAATFGFAELSALARVLEAGSEAMSAADLQGFIATLGQAFEKVSQLAQAQLLVTDREIAR